MYKLTCILLVVVLLIMQYQFWQQMGKTRELRTAVANQQAENEQLMRRNAELVAEVEDLRAGDQAIEERARSQMGLIAEGEQFIQLVPESVFAESEALNSSLDTAAAGSEATDTPNNTGD